MNNQGATVRRAKEDAVDMDFERAVMRKVYWRLVPLLFLAMFMNYLDRFNIGFAALKMNHDMGFSPAVFGFGASMFFFGYMLLGVPSNLVLFRVGARRWLGLVLVVWGVVAASTAFIWSEGSFFSLRFILGMVEAGYLPGVALYVTYWFPAAYRARAVGGYIIAGQVSAVVGSPLSAFLMTTFQQVLGIHDWQWMFLLEGLPTVLLGLVFLSMLTDRPANAHWLSPRERDWLTQRLADERAKQDAGRPIPLSAMLTDLRVWSLAILFGCALVGIYGLLVWLPQIVKSLGHLSLMQIGLLSAVPPLLGVIGTLIVSWNSDRTGDRKYHLAALYGVAGVMLAGSAFAPSPVLAYLMLCVVGLCINSGNSLFWSINASLMTGVAAAGSIAFVNTVAQFGGLVGPWMIGVVKGYTGSYSMALFAMACSLILSALITLSLRVRREVPAGAVAPAPSSAD